MPTPIQAPDKAAFIALVNVRNAQEALRLQTVLVNYEDVPTAIGRQLEVFAQNPQYLFEVMATLSNAAALITAGVYNSLATYNSNVNNPVLIISTSFSSGITVTVDSPGIMVLGNSAISKVTVATTKRLDNLYIGPGAVVGQLDSTATDAFATRIHIKNYKNVIGKLLSIKYGSHIGNVLVDPGAFFGGTSAINPLAACAIPATSLAANAITTNSIQLDWVNPGGAYLFVTLFYKLKGAAVWIEATEADGDFLGTNGFIFRDLADNTYYEFKVEITCNNGGVSAPVTLTSKTVCCGSGGGGSATVYKTCKIAILVKDSPNGANEQELCNGDVIPMEYQSGTTITIPYLIGKKVEILEPFIMDNTNMQLFTETNFDNATGMYTVAGSGLTTFPDGSVITLNVNLALP